MKKYIVTLLAALTLGSCNVDVTNPNTLTTGTFWLTEQDAQYGINAVYNMFYKPGTWTRWMWFRLDLTSDEGTSMSPWAELAEWTHFQYYNYNFWEGNSWTYRDLYETIYRANQVLENVPNIEFSDPTKKEKILAQAKFLRGMQYYYLALLWGSSNKSLPIMLKPSQPSDQPESYTGTEVYEQAIKDLTDAIAVLPEKWDDANVGRASKGAALAFRAKAYMQLKRWNDAKTDLEWFVTGAGSSLYDLAPNYHHNFNLANENNIESVFEFQYSDIHQAPAGDDDFAVDPNLGQNRGQFFAPPGIGWTDGEINQWVVDEFKKELNNDGEYDIRLKWTCFYEGMNTDFDGNDRIYGINLNNEDVWQRQNWKNRVFYRKWSSECFRDFDDYHNPINIRLIRYADILLSYAECLVQSGGSLSDAVAQVDRVRARVNMPKLAVNHAAATTNSEAFLKRLQTERSLELCTEGHRWADIKRWGLTETQAGIDELKSRDHWFNNFVIGRHDVLPIPSNEINNNPNQTQNPNY